MTKGHVAVIDIGKTVFGRVMTAISDRSDRRTSASLALVLPITSQSPCR